MNARQQFEDRLADTLDEIRAVGLLRQMRLPAGIDLVSNDYLGLAEHPGLIAAMRQALGTLPAGSGGSRLLRGHHEVFERLEHRLARFCGSEAALLFGSGYAANIGLLQGIVGPGDVIFSDERNHASLIDGIRLTKASLVVYPHQNLDALDTALQAPRGGRAIVITESVFSMDGDLTPLRELSGLCERRDAVLIVDEAHATGVYGLRGSGRVEELGLRDRVLATMHTGGKALGSGGAWVAGSRVLRDVLVNRARTFIFSTAPLPVLAAALDAALDLVGDEPTRREELHRKALLLRSALDAHGLHVGGTSPIVPIIIGSNDSAVWLQRELMTCGFDVRAIRPPSVAPGTARLRVTVRVPLNDDELLEFAGAAGRLVRTALDAPHRVPSA
jgi:8-amino-7-oxononanoate synthase